MVTFALRTSVAALLALTALGLFSPGVATQEIGAAPSVGAYDLAADFPRIAHPYPRAGWVLGSQGGIFAESPDRIFVANRGELKLPAQVPRTFTGFWGSLVLPNQANANAQNPDIKNCIMILDGQGSLIESWTQWDHLFAEGRGPHTIKISPHDPERHVWVIDDYHHQIFEFTNDGKSLVRTIGERDAGGSDATHFRRPTEMDWLPDGTFFVSDGYGNTRVAKFDRNGNFLLDWGSRGTGEGQLNTPHGIAVGLNRRVYVSDRGNKRIQVFDENGKFIAVWPTIMAQTVMTAANGNIWVFDSDRSKYVQYTPDGKEVSAFTIPGTFAHQISADQNGVFYAAGSRHGQPMKYVPKPGANPGELMKPLPLKGAGFSTANGKLNVSGSWKLVKADPEPAAQRARRRRRTKGDRGPR